MIFINLKQNNSVMHLNQAEREFFRKIPRKFFCKKSKFSNVRMTVTS